MDDRPAAPRYAAGGVPLYVVIDVTAGQAVVHTDPGDAGYARTDERGPNDRLSVLGVDLDLAVLLGGED